MNDITPQLQTMFGQRLKENEPLANHTNYKIGGPARWMVEVKTPEELVGLLALLAKEQVPYYVLGGGSNVLADDAGFSGVVIRLGNREYAIEGTRVTAGAGVMTGLLARETADAGLEGFEWAISLPGTIGGALRGNAGCFGGEMKDNVVSVRVIRDGNLIELANADLTFGYRDSAVKHNTDVVWDVTFELKKGDTAALKAKLATTLAKRKATQPTSSPSAGCVFKNYQIQNDEELKRIKQDADIPPEMLASRILSAGWLIEQMDLKGKQIGNAKISEEHGNFILNLEGKATASDVMQLVSIAKMQARERFGIQLQEEIEYLGF